jgi:hypothetical protein
MKKKFISSIIVILAAANLALAQTTEVRISLNEQFFDALFEAVFTHLDEPSMPISGLDDGEPGETGRMETNASVPKADDSVWREVSYPAATESAPVCKEAIFLKKAVDGVNTAVRFRNGKISAPIAFRGVYNLPLIGCIEFQGWAETDIDVRFDQTKQAIVGNAKVLNVNLSGTGGVGSGVLARFVQSSIDRKINPLEIIRMDKLSFLVPVQQAGNLKMKALGMRHAVGDKTLDIYLKYQFMKG